MVLARAPCLQTTTAGVMMPRLLPNYDAATAVGCWLRGVACPGCGTGCASSNRCDRYKRCVPGASRIYAICRRCLTPHGCSSERARALKKPPRLPHASGLTVASLQKTRRRSSLKRSIRRRPTPPSGDWAAPAQAQPPAPPCRLGSQNHGRAHASMMKSH